MPLWEYGAAGYSGASRKRKYRSRARISSSRDQIGFVEGRKLLEDEKHTQDFILANNPVFFVDDLQRYKETLVTSVLETE